jgi:hypothetical protein
MKVKLFFLYLALVFVSAEVFATPIDGFDGFKWGTTKSEIIEARGDEPIIWGDFEVWQAKDGETVSGFPIKLIGYEFKDGCGEINETRSSPCFLGGGAYLLETTSTDDIATLTGLLRGKYGKDRITQEVVKKSRPSDGFLYANINSTRHIWQRADKSAIELFYKSYDRDYVENLNEVKKGVFRVGVRYYSSDYMKQTESTEPRKKSF